MVSISEKIRSQSLFNSTASRCALTEEVSYLIIFVFLKFQQVLYLGNCDLAFRIAQNFRLPITTIYLNCLTRLLRSKQTAQALNILKSIKVRLNCVMFLNF